MATTNKDPVVHSITGARYANGEPIDIGALVPHGSNLTGARKTKVNVFDTSAGFATVALNAATRVVKISLTASHLYTLDNTSPALASDPDVIFGGTHYYFAVPKGVTHMSFVGVGAGAAGQRLVEFV